MKLWYHDTDAQFHAMVVEDSKDDSNIQYDDNQRRKSGFSQENARVRYRKIEDHCLNRHGTCSIV